MACALCNRGQPLTVGARLYEPQQRPSVPWGTKTALAIVMICPAKQTNKGDPDGISGLSRTYHGIGNTVCAVGSVYATTTTCLKENALIEPRSGL
jgi:hypothetical protein